MRAIEASRKEKTWSNGTDCLSFPGGIASDGMCILMSTHNGSGGKIQVSCHT